MPDIMHDRKDRLKLIENIEGILGGRVLVYFTADRPIAQAMIADDAVLPLYDHLRAIGPQDRLVLYLYSCGGQMEAPWKIVTMLREFCKELFVVVPYKSYSASTMVAIGADKIYMTKKGELGPIDPSSKVGVPKDGSLPQLPELSVEDVAAYLTFMRDRAKLTDQNALANMTGLLAQHLTPTLLGRMERTYSHIRLVARNLLSLHKPPFDDRKVSTITEALTEKMYTHGHGIGRREAAEIGLDVTNLDGADEDVVWSLYESYESFFGLRESRDVDSYFPAGSDVYEKPDVAIACVESTKGLHACVGTLRAQRIRNIPPNPTININLQLAMPPNLQPQQLPAGLQQGIQQMMQQAVQQLQGLVAQELQKQAPIVGISANLAGNVWKKFV